MDFRNIPKKDSITEVAILKLKTGLEASFEAKL
jgi:hypothetical protein